MRSIEPPKSLQSSGRSWRPDTLAQTWELLRNSWEHGIPGDLPTASSTGLPIPATSRSFELGATFYFVSRATESSWEGAGDEKGWPVLNFAYLEIMKFLS